MDHSFLKHETNDARKRYIEEWMRWKIVCGIMNERNPSKTTGISLEGNPSFLAKHTMRSLSRFSTSINTKIYRGFFMVFNF